jgi:hypothetical protein
MGTGTRLGYLIIRPKKLFNKVEEEMKLIEMIISAWLLWAAIGLGLTIHGLYLAFSASIVIGIVALIIEPSPLIISLVYLGFGKDIPQMILQWLSS